MKLRYFSITSIPTSLLDVIASLRMFRASSMLRASDSFSQISLSMIRSCFDTPEALVMSSLYEKKS